MKNLTIDPLAKWAEKKQKSYGLQFAKIMSEEWFSGGMISQGCQYFDRRKWIVDKRLFVRGEQDNAKFKAGLSGDKSLYNQDFRTVNFGEKFSRIVSNGINGENYRLDIRAIDGLSMKLKKNAYNEHVKNMRTMDLRIQAKQELGLDLIPQGFVPEDEEELKIYSEINERPKIEIAEEIMINYVKRTNKWDNIEEIKNKNLTDIGICAARVYTCKKEGVKVEDIDPEYLVHGYTKRNDFSDCKYYGFIEQLTIGDIKRESGLGDSELREIAKSYRSYNDNEIGELSIDECEIDMLLAMRIDVVRFAFKTTKTTVYKKLLKNGRTIKITKKDEEFNPPENEDYKKVVDTKDTWMEGTYVVGTNHVYDYKESENIIRDELNKALPPFIVRATDIYKNKLHSFIDNIETIADGLNHTVYKIRQLRSQIKPDLINIDVDALADIVPADKKGSKKENWDKLIDILDVKGIMLSKTVNMGDNGIKTAAGARPMPQQQGSGLIQLLNVFARDYDLIRETTGINPARDGSMPADALVGVNQMAQLASNTVTKNIVDSATEHHKRVCETISSRIHAIFRNKKADHLRKIYERAVGKENVDALEAMKDRHLHDFGFTVEMLPTQKELAELREDLGIALNEGSIDVEVKVECLRIAKTNIKLSHQYLFYKRKKRIEQKTKEQQDMFRAKSESDMQSNTMATQNKIKEYHATKQIDLDFKQREIQLDLMKKQAEKQIEAPYDQIKFEQEVFIEQTKQAAILDLRRFQEEAKDNRIDKQSTQQSWLNVERKKDNPRPIDFQFKPLNLQEIG